MTGGLARIRPAKFDPPVSRNCASRDTRAPSSPSVIAVGVNCTPPSGVAAAVAEAAATGLPVVAYPNSGEGWDAVTRSWAGASHFHPDAVTSWRDAGAQLIGGCCRVTPEAISAVSLALRMLTH